MLRASLVAALSFAVLSACGPVLVGSGRLAEEERAIGPWRVIHVQDAIQVNVVAGEPGLTLTGDDNLLRDVQTYLEGEALVVRLVPGSVVTSSLGIRATVRGDRFEGGDASGASRLTGAATPSADFVVAASGASHVAITNLDAAAARITASGASSVTLSGRAAQFQALASGASTIDGLAAPVASAKVEGSGASMLKLHVTESITGALSGASQLMLRGGISGNGVHTSGDSRVLDN